MSENDNFIKLRDSNPYRYGKLIIFDDGTTELYRDVIEWGGEETDTYYQVKEGDVADKIAWLVYKNYVVKPEWYWWIICDVNNIENPLDLSDYVGQELLIPDIILFLLKIKNSK